MRPVRPWRLEPTLRFLALLPMTVAVAGLGLELAGRAVYGDLPANQRPAWLIAAGTGAIHILALVWLGPLLRAHSMTWSDAFGMFAPGWVGRVWVVAGLTVPAMVGAWILHQASGRLLDALSIAHDAQAAVDAVRSADRGWERGLLLGFAVVTAPLVEEVLFRGILWPFARDRGWQTAGALAVSAVFALIHANLAAFLPLFGLGLFWIWLYERTGDLSAPVLSHALFNGLNFVWILWAPAPPAP